VAARELVEAINIRSALDDSAEGGKQGAFRYQNVLALLNWIERYETNAPRDAKSLQDFLRFVTLGGDKKDDKEKEKEKNGKAATVTLCTLHAAKGLEFSVVFLIGCVEGQLPHSRTTDPRAGEASVADLDEERRLFYVGITRARDRLYLVAPERRLLRGKPTEVTPSRYMDDLPSEHIEDYERPPEKNLSFKELRALANELLGSNDEDSVSEGNEGAPSKNVKPPKEVKEAKVSEAPAAIKVPRALEALRGPTKARPASTPEPRPSEKVVTKLPQWRGRPPVVRD
jgi:ATP-dependent exoDNAse (exonuclease V) beta subunit